MSSKVIMSLEEYDRLQHTIYKQEKEIEQMIRDREVEMKKIFKLEKSYAGVGVYVDATDIIKEIYGEEITIKESTYRLRDTDLTVEIYGAYLEIKESE